VLDQLPLSGDERALDVGCGTGHLTAALAARLPRGKVVGADRSSSMLQKAASWLGAHAAPVRLARVDAAALPFNRAFDVVFSTATFHWVRDHAALFRSIVTALKPGGRLKAQCGGGPNLAVLLGRAGALMRTRRFAPYFLDWDDPWHFADVESTTRRLDAAGFVDVDVALQPSPSTFETPAAFADFIATVCVKPHVERMPPSEGQAFVLALTERAIGDDPPLTLDYWRLNITARRPA
jgi:trans-aconitate 2-methyltransferase